MSETAIHPGNTAQAEFWNGAPGRRWRDHQERHDLMLRPVSDLILPAAAARPGERIVDVGCGCGELAAALAERVAPEGNVLAVDISEPMLALARELAPAGLPLRFAKADATTYAFDPGAADLVFSRFGVMFFADPAHSFANLRRALKPGGRLVFACWREAKKNLWAIAPLREAKRHTPPLPETGPEDPGPFSFGDEARVRRILHAAGFADVSLTAHDLKIDIAIGRGLDSAVETAMSAGPTSRLLADESEAVRAAAEADIRKMLATHLVGDSVPLDGAIWVVTAKNPGG